MKRTRTTRRRAGIATLVAVFFVSWVVLAVMAFTSLFVTEVRRTRRTQAEAQMRQLLHAGAAVAAQRLNAAGPDAEAADFDLPLPVELAGDGVTLNVALSRDEPAGPVTAHVTVTAGERSSRQAVTFTFVDQSWRIESSRLN